MATATKEAPFLLASIFHSRLMMRSRFPTTTEKMETCFSGRYD